VFVIEFKPYVFMVDFKQWRISLWDPIYWIRSESGLTIGGTLHSWEDQQQYDVTFLMDAEKTAGLERKTGLELEKGALSLTYQKADLAGEDDQQRQDKLMRLADWVWLTCKYSAVDKIRQAGLAIGRDNRCEVDWRLE
jgi:hypothetical protein